MTFAELVRHSIDDTTQVSLAAFAPELALCGTIIAILLTGMIVPRFRSAGSWITVVGLAIALWLLHPWTWTDAAHLPPRTEIFSGLLIHDSFAAVMRAFLLFFGLLFTGFTLVSGVPRPPEAGEFFILVLGALLGMCLMVSANHLLIVFLAVEMASVPSYVLSGFLREKRTAAEAALKYAVFGAGAAGVMLYGISLLAGCLGAAHLPTAAGRLAELGLHAAAPGNTTALVLAGLMIAIGLAFKLSAVPFHFWTPDVFEGATAEVGAFLSVASKAAALGLLVRLVLGLGSIDPAVEQRFQERLRAESAAGVSHDPTTNAVAGMAVERRADVPPRPAQVSFAASALTPADAAPVTAAIRAAPASARSSSRAGDIARAASADVSSGVSPPSLSDALLPTRKFISGLLALLAAVTCTFGNLAAYGQTNMKRLLAYSTIAHAGYLLMPVAALALLVGGNTAAARFAVASLVVYVGVYLFMNLAAFAIVAALRNANGSEAIASYAGLIRRSPGLAICAALVLFSLVGLPPLAGFLAKFAIFSALVQAGLLLLLAIGGVNTVLSLFYYLRVVRVMTLEAEVAEQPLARVPLSSPAGLYCLLLTLPLVIFFVWADAIWGWATTAAATIIR